MRAQHRRELVLAGVGQRPLEGGEVDEGEVDDALAAMDAEWLPLASLEFEEDDDAVQQLEELAAEALAEGAAPQGALEP